MAKLAAMEPMARAREQNKMLSVRRCQEANAEKYREKTLLRCARFNEVRRETRGGAGDSGDEEDEEDDREEEEDEDRAT
jgi:hypothetical protein